MIGISVKDLAVSFGETKILEDISFSVEAGEIVTILGPSGCGKSTILRCIASLHDEYKGEIFLNETCLVNDGRNQCNKDIGYIFQDYALFPHLNVRENIEFALYKLKQDEKQRRVDVLLKQSRDILKVSGTNDKKINEIEDKNKKIYKILLTSKKTAKELKKELLKVSSDIEKSYSTLSSKWFIEFLKFEPKKYLEKANIPTLVLSGEKDLQVDAVTNNKAIELALKVASNKNYKIINFKNLNHLFQTAKTGNPSEYGKLDEIMNEKVMQEVITWLKLLK